MSSCTPVMVAEDVDDDTGLHQQQDDVHFGNPIRHLAKATAAAAAAAAAVAFAPPGAAAAGGAPFFLAAYNLWKRAPQSQRPRKTNTARSSRKLAAAKEESVSSLILELHNKLAGIVGVKKLTQQHIVGDFTAENIRTLQLLQDALTNIIRVQENKL